MANMYSLLYIFVYIFSSSSLVRVVANLRRCLHYHIILYTFCTSRATLRGRMHAGDSADVRIACRLLQRFPSNCDVTGSVGSHALLPMLGTYFPFNLGTRRKYDCY